MELIDGHAWSKTMRCSKCEHCSLLVASPMFRLMVRSATFHERRGSRAGLRPLDDHSMASRLVDCLILDVWPSAATIIDWGIDSPDHLGALQHAVIVGVSAYDLDRVIGDGPAITALTRGIPGQPYPDVVFKTAYDALFVSDE